MLRAELKNEGQERFEFECIGVGRVKAGISGIDDLIEYLEIVQMKTRYLKKIDARERPTARERRSGSTNGSMKYKVCSLGSIFFKCLCRLSSGAIGIVLLLNHVL